MKLLDFWSFVILNTHEKSISVMMWGKGLEGSTELTVGTVSSSIQDGDR